MEIHVSLQRGIKRQARIKTKSASSYLKDLGRSMKGNDETSISAFPFLVLNVEDSDPVSGLGAHKERRACKLILSGSQAWCLDSPEFALIHPMSDT